MTFCAFRWIKHNIKDVPLHVLRYTGQYSVYQVGYLIVNMPVKPKPKFRMIPGILQRTKHLKTSNDKPPSYGHGGPRPPKAPAADFSGSFCAPCFFRLSRWHRKSIWLHLVATEKNGIHPLKNLVNLVVDLNDLNDQNGMKATWKPLNANGLLPVSRRKKAPETPLGFDHNGPAPSQKDMGES